MARYRLAGPAHRAIVDILRHSAETFGPTARERYAVLFMQAMSDVATDPNRTGVIEPTVSNIDLGLYHLKHARARVDDAALRVKQPRHALVFEVGADGVVNILGVIHERMLLGPALARIVRNKRDDIL